MKPYVIWKMFHKVAEHFLEYGGTNSQNFSARSQPWWRLHWFHVRTGLLKKKPRIFQCIYLLRNWLRWRVRSSKPAGIYFFKVSNRSTRKRCQICSKLTIKTPGRRHWRRFKVFIVHFEHISHLFLEFLLLTLSK